MLSKENFIPAKHKLKQNQMLLKIDNNLLDFIFHFCSVGNLSREASQSSVYLFEYFVNSTADVSKFDIQLVAMTCIFVCSKMFDVKPLSLSTLHRISAHIYNNSMILNMELTILNTLDYDLFFRDELIVDRVGVYLESIRFLLEEKDFEKFSELTFKLSDLIYEDMYLVKTSNFNLLCAALIQSALVISTKREGKMPITIRCKLIILK